MALGRADQAARRRGAELNKQRWPDGTFLGLLSDRTRRAALELGAMTSYHAGQRILRQGEESDHVLVLTTGVVKVVADTEFGKPVVLVLRGPGDLLGDVSAFDEGLRAGDLVACTSVHARLISQAHLREFLGRHPDGWPAAVRSLASRLRSASARHTEFVACPAQIRVGRVLVDIAERFGTPVSGGRHLDLALTQPEIASLAGVALPTFEKALRLLRQTGLVRRRQRPIVIEDLPRLRRFCLLDQRNPYQYGVCAGVVAQS